MIEGSSVTASSWFCVAQRLGKWSRKTTGRGAAHSLDWLAVIRSTPRGLFFFGAGSHTVCVEVLGLLLMAPKTLKTPRAVRGKPNLEKKMRRRDQKHPLGPSKTRANVQRKAQQSGPLMEKLQDSVSHVPTVDTGPQIPEMFKQPLRVKHTPPPQSLVIMGRKVLGLQYITVMQMAAQGLRLGQCTARMEQV
ncbi:hypothetical protein NDU88_002863 [Pleurodeles waltl]|uniref:Uncharacterized protein n=1 Tax=Pleurodeles waltl TaxID=8319 RepID=A0AAV7PAL6_PLEWA|nr:hypothetical protein NDU88_002863 [Pleurodeles waltl]